jgi:hypothetical protein
LVLGFHVTGFTAGTAVILAVLAEANVKLGTAEPAVLGAATAALGLITENADEIPWHRRSLAEGIVSCKVTNGESLAWGYRVSGYRNIWTLKAALRIPNPKQQLKRGHFKGDISKETFLLW